MLRSSRGLLIAAIVVCWTAHDAVRSAQPIDGLAEQILTRAREKLSAELMAQEAGYQAFLKTASPEFKPGTSKNIHADRLSKINNERIESVAQKAIWEERLSETRKAIKQIDAEPQASQKELCEALAKRLRTTFGLSEQQIANSMREYKKLFALEQRLLDLHASAPDESDLRNGPHKIGVDTYDLFLRYPMTFPRRKVLVGPAREELVLQMSKMESEISVVNIVIKALDNCSLQEQKNARVVSEEISQESMMQDRVTLLKSAILVVDFGLALGKSRTAN